MNRAKLPGVTHLPSPHPQKLPLSFVISDCPTPERLPEYTRAFTKLQVTDVIRICESSYYDAQQLESLCSNANTNTTVKVIDDIKFEDGGVPSPELLSKFLDLLADRIQAAPTSSSTSMPTQPNSSGYPALAMHCVSGLGRAPVLVAVAILEYCDHMEPLDVVEYIRGYRRGALNKVQLKWLEDVYAKKLRRKDFAKRRRQRSTSPMKNQASDKTADKARRKCMIL